ncbi:deoxyribose-phosphate aldolase [bacterium]|nr:deoxyribose-phosphate aldolase [bacterium]
MSSNLGCSICNAPAPSLSQAISPKSQQDFSTGKCKKADCSRSYGSCSSSCETSVREVIQAGADRIEKGHDAPVPAKDLARYIDHTLLKPDATTADITKLCDEARQFTFASVCVNPGNVSLAAKLLKGTPVKVCTVVGFPLGATSTFTKVMETRDAIANGATEIDMVINVGGLKSKDFEMVKNDISRVVEAAGNNTVKVILETALLTEEEKIKGCELSKLAGADFVKTSTGFSSGGATAADIALMRRVVGPSMGVKASGGIRDTKTAQEMIAAGATRVGASASVQIVKGEAAKGKGY